uniref:EGF-like domain-containing protein n=1 Tax=Romanomermis culicivorax TaxID=13658 RepID=A0A915KXR1_ROMCU
MTFRRLIFVASLFLIVAAQSSESNCPCQNGGTCSNDVCFCPDGWTGKQCQRPCVDFYKSCAGWDEEGRCQWTRGITTFFLDNCPVTCGQCKFDNKTVPKGLPLPPILEPLKAFVGVWRTETTFPDRFPVKFESASGYSENLTIAIAEVPGFDTPSLNYTVDAVSLNDENDAQREVGFLWMKPGNGSTKLVGNMMVVNSGLIIIQEGVLENGVITLNTTTYSQFYPLSRNPEPTELTNNLRKLELTGPDRMTQTVSPLEGNGRTYAKYYTRIADF